MLFTKITPVRVRGCTASTGTCRRRLGRSSPYKKKSMIFLWYGSMVNGISMIYYMVEYISMVYHTIAEWWSSMVNGISLMPSYGVWYFYDILYGRLYFYGISVEWYPYSGGYFSGSSMVDDDFMVYLWWLCDSMVALK